MTSAFEVLRASAAHPAPVASAPGLPATSLGVYGSALYKPADRCADFDFIVYGEANARLVLRTVRALLTAGEPYKRGATVYHLRFKLPGTDTWYDPRYWRPEPYTAAIAARKFTAHGTEDLDHAGVTDDRYGLFTPSVYGLDDGTYLLSYRLGHAAYLHSGDWITGRQIPVCEMSGTTYRVILAYEDLQKDHCT